MDILPLKRVKLEIFTWVIAFTKKSVNSCHFIGFWCFFNEKFCPGYGSTPGGLLFCSAGAHTYPKSGQVAPLESVSNIDKY